MTDVTVIIPCYNNSATIEAAVESAINQTVPTNVIVVDDGSKDETADKVKRLAADNQRLRLLIQTRNQGPSAARNRAIALAETPWIAILDADDYMHPDRIRRMLQVGMTEDLDIVADDLIRLDNVPHPTTGTRLWSDDPIGLIEINLARFARENIAAKTGSRRELGYLKPLIRTDFLRTHRIGYDEDMRLAEDYALYMRALVAGARFGLIDPCGYFSVDYPGSLSKEYGAVELRRVLERDIEFLGHAELTSDERKAIGEHKLSTHKQWAWVHLIEMVRERSFSRALISFRAPPEISLTLALRVFRHAIGRDPVPQPIAVPSKQQRISDLLAIQQEFAGG